MGASEEAILSYEKVLEIEPDFSTAHHNRALALSGIGRQEEAVEGFKKAIELSSEKTPISWMCLGGALRSLERYEESLACFDKAIELGTGRYFEWGGRVIPLLKLGCYREALVSGYKCLASFRLDYGFREWFERRISIDLRILGLQPLIPVWRRFLRIIGWRVGT